MSERWFFAKDKKKHGPVSRDVLEGMLARGELLPTDMVLQEGAARWMPASALVPAPSFSPPLEPDAKAQPDAGASAAGAGRKGVPGLSALGEVPGAVGAAFSQTARLVGYWGHRRQTGRLADLSRQAQLDLGMGLVQRQLGDPESCRRAMALEDRLRIIREAKGSDRDTLRERDALLVQLAAPWLRSATPPPQLEQEHRRAVHAEQTRLAQEEKRSQARAGLFPTSTGARVRLGAGFAMLTGLVILGVVVLLPLFHSSDTADMQAFSRPRGEEKTPTPKGNPASRPGPLETPSKDPGLETKDKDRPKDKEPPKEKEPAPPVKKSLKELFAQLAPAVPMVEAINAGGGSGFLVQYEGKHLVITNRHVIQNARSGLEVHFLRTAKGGEDERLVIGPAKAKLTAVHRQVDLAIIDVSSAGAEIARWGIQPVTLAARDYVASVGEHVFAIGHPGDAGGGVLTRTLSDGIVSAVRRKDRAFPGSFTQVTVPINPGNSGGPIFDDEGKVIAIATFIIRKSKDRDLTLEALNFGLDVRFVHELLADRAQSLTPQEIAGLFQGLKQPPLAGNPEFPEIQVKLKALALKGYRPFTDNLERSMIPFRLAGLGQVPFTLKKLLPRDQIHVFVVSRGSTDVGLHVFDSRGHLVKQDSRVNPDPEVSFRAFFGGDYRVVISNMTNSSAEGIMVLMLKAR